MAVQYDAAEATVPKQEEEEDGAMLDDAVMMADGGVEAMV